MSRDTGPDADALWRGVRDRKPDAFNAIYAQHAPAIRAFLRHVLGALAAADDVTQETFLQIWKQPDGFDRSRGSLRQYLFGIARKRAAQYRRETPVGTPIDPAELVRPRAIAPRDPLVRHAFDALDRSDRELLWLREIEGYSYDELAAIFDVPVGTVKSRLFHARAALREVWLGAPANTITGAS